MPYTSNGNITNGGDYLPLVRLFINITSPVNNTSYYKTYITLNFTINKQTSWIGYSLNNTANLTITGPINLTGLAKGNNSVKIFANDTSGNMVSSFVKFFYCLGDINGDGKVNMFDVGFVAKLFLCNSNQTCYSGTTAGIPNSNADINGDGVINMVDVGIVAKQFGTTC